MYKNQLQELAQRSCFNLPSYSCIREGPDHAPRFKATVNFNGETFESPTFCSTLRQAEHAAAEIALNALANRGPSRALAARVLDETGVYKNLLQETAHRAGLNLPVYTTVRSGLGHFPVFSCTAELAGMTFTGEPAKTKKRAQKNAAMAAWSALKQLSRHGSSSCPSLESEGNQEQEQATIARFLTSLQPAESNNSTPNNRQYGQQRSIAICGGSTPPTSSLYSMPYQSYPYSSLSPEMAVYQMWQQGQSLQPSHLLALPVPPAPPPGPQIFPLMQSIFGPDHHLYFPAEQQELIPVGSRITIATSCPSFYFSNHQIPDLISSKSMVTIQEIEEKKTEESSEVSPSEVHNPPVLCYDNTAQIIQEPLQEDDKQKNGTPETKVGNSVQLKGDRTEQFEWASHRSVGPRFRPVESRQQNPHGFDSSQSIHRPHHYPRAGSHRSVRPPSSVAAPVTIRTVGSISSMGHRPQNLATQMPAPPGMRTGFPSCSTEPRGQQMDLGRVPSNLMAPAVRIRSVVPVCSAPPAKKMPSSSQEELLSGREKKSTEDVSTASSEFHKLRM